MNNSTETSAQISAQITGAPLWRIEVFGFDVAEISQIRRIRALVSLGYDVHSFTMRRANMNVGFEPEWPNTHLYDTVNQALGKRAMVVAKSILKSTRHRARLRAADVIIARNMDMLAIAVAAKRLAGAKAPVIYECLDINGSLIGTGAKSKAMRWAERALLRQVDMLAVSSPGFIKHYFEPMQGYRGPHDLWENKLAVGAALPKRPVPAQTAQAKLKLGWVGTLRCAPTLKLLDELTRRMDGMLEVHAYGVVHEHAVPDFHDVVGANPAFHFHGAYSYPADLPKVYGNLDLVWAQDLWNRGGNSDWLLPNRIYEASWAGCPCVAVDGTETAFRIVEDQLGWTVSDPTVDAVEALLKSLTRQAIQDRSAALLQTPETNFVQTPDDIKRTIEHVIAAQAKPRSV